MRLPAALAAVAVVCACSGTGGSGAAPASPLVSASPSAARSATPSALSSPEPAAQALAVYDGPALSLGLHLVTLVAITGPPGPWDRQAGPSQVAKVVASVPAAYRTWRPRPDDLGPIELPYISTSSSTVYFLDGDATLRSLSVKGAVKSVETLPGDSARRVAFAVSPDDKRIAVAVIDYSPARASAARAADGQPAPALQLYVEDLSGGYRVSVFESSGLYYWPVGWHNGKIVLAGGPALTRNYLPLNPYSASRYFLIDAMLGSKPVALGTGDCAPTGAITSAGTACVSDPGLPCTGSFAATSGGTDWYTSCLRKLDWSGVETNFLMARYYLTKLTVTQAALSSDGGVILTDGYFLIKAPVDGHGDWQNQFGMPPPAAPERPGMGWIDAYHLSMMYVQSNGTGFQRILRFTPDREEIVNVVFDGYPVLNGVATSPFTGQLLGTVPGGL